MNFKSEYTVTSLGKLIKFLKYYLTYFSKTSRTWRKVFKQFTNKDVDIFVSDHVFENVSTYSNAVKINENKIMFNLKRMVHRMPELPTNEIMIVDRAAITFPKNYLQNVMDISIDEKLFLMTHKRDGNYFKLNENIT